MQSQRKKLLLVWGYHRKDWLDLFQRIEQDFEYVFLYWIFPDQDQVQVAYPVKYWSDYQSAQQILDDVKPDKVVFLGLDTPNAIMLRSVCRKRRITTYFLQHGMTNNLETYLHFSALEAKSRVANPNLIPDQHSSKGNLYKFLILFVLRSTRLYNLGSAWDAFLLQYYKRFRNMLELEALNKVPGARRIPDVHIDYSKFNAQLYVERDDLNPERIVEVGMPHMDTYFEQAKIYHTREDEPYLLMIDQPITQNKTFNLAGYGISEEQMNAFYLKLNAYALSVGCKLYVKLHPNSYEDDFRVQHPNIRYIRQADNPKLILESAGVFGMFSTMMVPAVYFKPCCVFRLWDVGKFEACVEELGVAQVLRFHEFESTDIQLLGVEREASGMTEFVKRYFYRADGGSIERVRDVLSKTV